ncbi:MAG TPA: tryptophan 7-halogenase [Allosphingosinicella sp.]|jgi:tryptophan halogenase
MSAPADRAIRGVAVLGGGIVGLSAAIAFARALPRARVEVVETPADPAALCDRLPGSLPTIHRFHAALGLDELDLVRRGIATHRLGTRFEHWSADGEPWYHVYGEYGFGLDGAPFPDLWARARRAGQALPYHLHAPAALLAEAGKFVHPEARGGSPLATYLYALRLDPDPYRERLAAQADGARIARTRGRLEGVERREDGGLAALRLDGGRRLEADLFLDCSGPSAPLAAAVDARFEEWGEWLPADRLLLGARPGAGVLATADTVAAAANGWQWSAPLPDRTFVGQVFASATTDEAAAREAFGVPGAEAVSIRQGRRPEPWTRNVLAIGDSAVALDPLHWAGLHLAQSAILRALELLPGRDCHPLELREYNRRTGQETQRVRDFLALHYLRSGRGEGAFWTALAGRAPPESLAHTLEQFEARGRLPFYEEESFDKQAWLAALLGLGVLPREIGPAAAGVPPGEAAATMKAFAERLAALPARLPAYRDYLAKMAGLPPSAIVSRLGA